MYPYTTTTRPNQTSNVPRATTAGLAHGEPLRDGRDRVTGGAHLREHLVQPLEGSVEVNLDPARGGGNVLSMVLCTPPLDETHPYGTMFGEFIHRFVPMVHTLRQQLCKFLIVEDLQCTLRRNLAHGGRMEAVMEVAVPALHEYGGVAEALGEDLTTHVVEVDTLTDVSSCILDRRVPVHVGHATQTEAVGGCVWVGEAVDDETGTGCLEGFTYSYVEFVVGDGTPVLWFVVCDGGHVWRNGGFGVHRIGIGSRTSPIF
jgi:hypothetical protein